MISKFLNICILLLVGASVLHGQASVPITAKVRDTSEVLLNGKVIETNIREGLFYRNSAGSEVRRWTTLDDKPVTGEMTMSSLQDAEHGISYAVDYQGRKAYIPAAPPVAPPEGANTAEEQRSLGENVVQGLSCEQYPIYLLSPGQPRTLIGRHCKSAAYDLDLTTETNMKEPAGKSIHQMTELYDIQIGVEPDPKLFDLSKFTIVKEEAKR